MDLGVRYDFERLPHSLPTDANNISPRVGLAYQPAPQWVVRAGYGIFCDRYVLAALNQALQKNGAAAFEQVVDSAAATLAFQGAAGGPWPAPLPGVPPRFTPWIATWRPPTASRRALRRNTSARTT